MGLAMVASKSYGGKSEKDRLAEGEAILRDRGRGMQVSELMAKYGISRATLYRRIDDAVAARIAPTVDAYREEQNAVLDDMVSRWEQQAAAAELMVAQAGIEADMAALERGMKMRADALVGLLRVAERRAKLMGLDAPTKVDATVSITSPTDSALEQLAAEIGAR